VSQNYSGVYFFTWVNYYIILAVINILLYRIHFYKFKKKYGNSGDCCWENISPVCTQTQKKYPLEGILLYKKKNADLSLVQTLQRSITKLNKISKGNMIAITYIMNVLFLEYFLQIQALFYFQHGIVALCYLPYSKGHGFGKILYQYLSGNDRYFVWLKDGIIRLLNVLYAMHTSAVKL